MFEYLKQPYPLEISFQKNLKISLFTGFFIAFFLYVFQPVNVLFGVEKLELWISLVYGFISFGTMFSSFHLIPNKFSNLFNEEKWIVKKEIIHLFITIFFIALLNYIFTVVILKIEVGPSIPFYTSFIPVFSSTFLLAFFPLSAIVFYRQNLYLKRYLLETDEINLALNKTDFKENIKVEGSGKNESISFELEDLYFIKSQGNYCEFFFTDNKKEVLRNSLVDVQSQISSNKIYKCHRSYLVHLDNIDKVSGNAQGLRLHFDNEEESVPVSRSLSNEMRALLLKNS